MNYCEELELRLKQVADPDLVAGMEAYMKHKFRYLGIKSTPRREILKQFIKGHGLPHDADCERIIMDLWTTSYRELHYCALEIAQRKKWYKKPNGNELFEWMITHNSWWDTVDSIATNLCGPFFKAYPEKLNLSQKWNQSENMWLIRTSIIYQLKYGNGCDKERLKAYILPHLGSKEFFIQKAIGWSLRQLSKYDRKFVADFVENHELKPVSKREAIKYL